MKKTEPDFDGQFGRETIHNMKRRAVHHDYHRVGIYMLTLVVKNRRPLLGNLRLDSQTIELSALGYEILNVEFLKISKVHRNVQLWQIVVMPDHLHILIRVKEDFPHGKHLGAVISGFKNGCNRAYWRIHKIEATDGRERPGLFESGYNDTIIFGDRQAEVWKRYLIDNPRRLALKRLNPELFHTVYGVNLMGLACQIYGNRFLLDYPEKMAVIVHRADDDATFERKKREWLACGERGGVLVSAAIAKREKEVMREAMNRGYSLIWLCDMGFSPFYKPPGEFFNACVEGRLLEVSPWDYSTQRKVITRQECLLLNRLAEWLAKD